MLRLTSRKAKSLDLTSKRRCHERYRFKKPCIVKSIGSSIDQNFTIENISLSGILTKSNHKKHGLTEQSIVEVNFNNIKFLAKPVRFIGSEGVAFKIIQMDGIADRKWNQVIAMMDKNEVC